MVRIFGLVALALLPQIAEAADEDIVGTYRLISSQRVILDTGEKEDSYGKNPNGFITYGSDGRMTVVIVRSDRSKPESLEQLTDMQRAELFRSMAAYAGTYKFYGDRVEHYIDASWNEIWTGTTQVRDVKREGDRVVLCREAFEVGRLITRAVVPNLSYTLVARSRA